MKTTIKSAAQQAIKIKGQALKSKEIYEVILEHKLFEFNATSPMSVLNSVLRKYSGSVKNGKVVEPCFSFDTNGKYSNL